MRTKEYILEKETFGIFDEYEGGITGIHNAMEVYAKEVAIDFVDWLLENTEIIKEEKITLFRYCDNNNEYGNYTLEDIHVVYMDELSNV